MPSFTATADAAGKITLPPPYSLPDGAYVATVRQAVGGAPGPAFAPVAFTMPNAAKSAALAIIGRMSVSAPAGRPEAIYTLVSALMAAGIWSRLDLLYLLAAHDSQAARLNWIGPSFDPAAYNSPIFAANRGIKGDGAAAYLQASGYTPTSGTTRLTLNSACVGAWVLTPGTVGGIDVGLGSGFLARRSPSSSDYTFRINDGTSNYAAVGGSSGLVAAGRSDAATKRAFRNGSLLWSTNVAAATLATGLSVVGGSGGQWSNTELAAVFAGASLTDAQHATVYAALRTYLLAVGAITS